MAMSGEKTGEYNDKNGIKAGNLGPHDIGGLEFSLLRLADIG